MSFFIPPLFPPSLPSNLIPSLPPSFPPFDLPSLPPFHFPSLPSVVTTHGSAQLLSQDQTTFPGKWCPEVSSIGISALAGWAIKEFASNVNVNLKSSHQGQKCPKLCLEETLGQGAMEEINPDPFTAPSLEEGFHSWDTLPAEDTVTVLW